MVWLKGSLHTHTSESDGDQTPELVSRWYQEHGYDFLVISDHNHLTVIDTIIFCCHISNMWS